MPPYTPNPSRFEQTLGGLRGRTDQFLRAWRVILSGDSMPGGGGGDESIILSSDAPTGEGLYNIGNASVLNYAAGLRMSFQVNQANSQTPNTAEITIYNLEDNFAKNLIKENNYVILQAGYEWGRTGTIFTGTIKAFKRGHENVTDSYLKIYAADGDKAHNEAVIAKAIKAGTNQKEKVELSIKEMEKRGVTRGYVDPRAVTLGPNIRDEVLYGLVADVMRDFAGQNGAMINVLDQKFNYTKPDSYKPGAIIELTAESGLIGFPEQTQDGINLVALINPAIRLMQRIRINNKLINQYHLPGNADKTSGDSFGFNYPTYSSFQQFAKISDDGVYTPWQITYEGDSRGGPWYMHMVCMTVDATKDNERGSLFGGLLAVVLN